MYSVNTPCVLCLGHNILCELNNDCVFYLLGFGIGAGLTLAGECNFCNFVGLEKTLTH